MRADPIPNNTIDNNPTPPALDKQPVPITKDSAMIERLSTGLLGGARAYVATLRGLLNGLVIGGVTMGLVVGLVAVIIYSVQFLGGLRDVDAILVAGIIGAFPGLLAFGYGFGWGQMLKIKPRSRILWSVGSSVAAVAAFPAWFLLADTSSLSNLFNVHDTLQMVYWVIIATLWSIAQVISVRLSPLTLLRFAAGNAATVAGVTLILRTLIPPTFHWEGLIGLVLLALGWAIVGNEHVTINEKLKPAPKPDTA